MVLFRKILTSFIVIIILTTNLLPVKALDTVMGIPISKFDEVNSAKLRMNNSISDMEMFGSDYYALKYRFDTYGYAYYILSLKEMVGSNTVKDIEEHLTFYNSSLLPPIDPEEDEIKFSKDEQSGTVIVTSVSEDFKKKLITLIGTEASIDADTEDLINSLSKLRVDAGFPADSTNDLTYEDSTLSEDELELFIRNNISEIRILLTVTKDFIDQYFDIVDYSYVEFLTNYFAETYDLFVQFSKKADIEGIRDIDLFGENEGVTFDPNRAEAFEDIGDWNITDKNQILESNSEYVLKGIAASSTFRPFDTNMNSTQAFGFLGDQMQLFHEAYGTKRKLLLTPVDAYNDLNVAIDLNASKSLKLMTLKQFIEDPKKNKVLYLDNLDYDLSQIDSAQTAVAEEDTADASNSSEEADLTNVAGNTAQDNNRGFWANVNHALNSAATFANSTPILDWFVLDGNLPGMEGYIETLVFASGDVSKVSKVKKSLESNKELITMSNLVYTNIMAEYKGSSRLKLKADMDKPLTIDIYGNILSASGIVIIPAISNPFTWAKTESQFTLNRAFIESYPEYTIDKGKMIATKDSKGKKIIALSTLEEGESEPAEEAEEMSSDDSAVSEDPVESSEPEETVEVDTTGSSNSKTFITNVGPDIAEEFEELQAYAVNVGSEGKILNKLKLPKIKPTADKFDNEYKPIKALDVYSFVNADKGDITDYASLTENIMKLKLTERLAYINQYTVKLNYSETGTTEVVTFKDLPDSNELKKFLYITNLQELIKVDSGTISDAKKLSTSSYKITEEVFKNGVYHLNELNSLVPDNINSVYGRYINLLLEQSNNRHDSVLSTDASNSLLYNSSVEETKALKTTLPLVFNFMLLIAVATIIMIIIFMVFTKESKFKQVGKVMIVIYLLSMLFQITPWIYDSVINKPLKWLYSDETISWTVVDQEENLHRVKQTTSDELVEKAVNNGSIIKLYKLNYEMPFDLLGTQTGISLMNVDEFQTTYLSDENVFNDQNNHMWVDGRYVVTNTSSLFDSSSIVVNNPKDVLMRLEHDVYKTPELSYYLPYYMFIDNIIFNLNAVTDITKKVPNEMTYESGDTRTTGRLKDLISSPVFLDYELFEERIKSYKGSDEVSEELAEASLISAMEKLETHEDFLGIKKILNTQSDAVIEPFTSDQVTKATNSAWYPEFDMAKNTTEGETATDYDMTRITEEDKQILQQKADKINEKTKKFMLALHPYVDTVSDETLIKTIALYASLEFNKEFSKWQKNSFMPTHLELKDVSVERILMAMAIKREDLIKTDFKSYPLLVLDSLGYIGLHFTTFNDILIVTINYVKPLIATGIWLMTAVVIFTRKVLFADSKNQSILGSLKIITMYCLLSLAYGFTLWINIKLTNWGVFPIIQTVSTLIFSLLYILSLLLMSYWVVRDFWNLGSSYMFQGLEKMVKSYSGVLKGIVGNSAIGRSGGLARTLNKHVQSLESLGGNLENKALRSIDGTGDIEFKKPINFSVNSIKSGSQTVAKTSKDILNLGKSGTSKVAEKIGNARQKNNVPNPQDTKLDSDSNNNTNPEHEAGRTTRREKTQYFNRSK